jgi:hypothetical protein
MGMISGQWTMKSVRRTHKDVVFGEALGRISDRFAASITFVEEDHRRVQF